MNPAVPAWRCAAPESYLRDVDTESDRAVVWVDRWQMECCGTPFAVGDPVAWSVRRDVDRAFLTAAAAPEVADAVQYREEHHEDTAEDAVDPALEVTGHVRAIRAVTCRYEVDQVEGGSSPAPGSGMLTDVTGTAARPPQSAGRSHVGWVVALEVSDVG